MAKLERFRPRKAVLFLAVCSLAISAQEPAWVLKSPATIPAARTMHSMAYDELRRQIVLFGGNNVGSEYERFWLWDGTNWIHPTPAHLPGGRNGAAMAFHAATGEVILFGGTASGLLSNETWAWNGVDWTQRFPVHSPSPRRDIAMAYDSARRQTILFGGFASDAQPSGETWAWDGADWTRLNPSASPLPRSLHAMTYDPVRQQVVLFGGQGGNNLGDTWVWDGTNWTPKQSNPAPPARIAHALQFDPRLAVCILHGGSPVTTRDSTRDTWAWDGSTWKLYANQGQPLFRTAHAMAYDQTRGELILFGGTDGRQNQNLTWAWVVPTVGQTNLQISPTSLTFEQSPPGPQPAPQSIAVTTTGGAAPFSVSVSTSDGRNWLRVSAEGGTTPANLTVSADATGLAPGSYSGTLTITAPSAVNSPRKLSVQLEVRQGYFIFQPPMLSFESLAGATTPITRQIQVSTLTPGQVAFTATTSQPWVTVSPVAGVSPTFLNVTVQPANLPVGNNRAQVTLASTTSQVAPGSFSVDASIRMIPQLTVTPLSVNSALARNAAPQKVALNVHTTSPSAIVRAEVDAGATWLTIDPPSGTAAPDFPFNLTLNPTGLTAGNYSALVYFKTTDTNQTPATVAVNLTVLDSRRIVSQIADGSLWQTTLTLVNLGANPAPFALRFYANGMPLPLPLDGFTGRQSVVESVIQPNGTRVIRTTGTDALLSQGWAELESAGDLEGVGVFRQRAAGRPDLEAAVTTTTPASRFILPFDNLQSYTTSLALVNPSLSTLANLSVQARAASGALLSPSSLSLPAGNHAAFASQTLFPATANQSGVLDVTGNTPFTGLGLRFDPAGPFTSYPLMAIPTQPVQNQILSQLADGGPGGEWQTTFTLVNLDTQSAPYTLRFWAQSGLPLAVPIAGQLTPAQTLQSNIPVGGVHTIVTKGEATPLVQGWTELVSNNAIGGLAVFHQRIPGQTGNAAVVTAAPRARNMVLPYDNTDGALTSVALVNADASRSATLAIGLYDEAGALFGSELLQLPPRGQTAFLLIDRLPALRNRRGILRIACPESDISGVALRFNPAGAFTSIPLLIR